MSGERYRRSSRGGAASWLVGVCFPVGLLFGCTIPAEDPDAAVVPDGGQVIDAAPPADTASPPDAEVVTSPSSHFQTAGGGPAGSANYRAEVRLGAPQPMGEASSANYHVRLGPTTE